MLPQPNAERRYEVSREWLPLHCPPPGMPLRSSHPKVYLPIEAAGEAKCPYCGTTYVLLENGGAPAGEPASEGAVPR